MEFDGFALLIAFGVLIVMMIGLLALLGTKSDILNDINNLDD